MKLFSRREAVLVTSLLLICAILFLVFFLLRGNGSGEWDVVVKYKGETAARLPLETDVVYLFECEEGTNTITVKDGAVSVTSADCKRQICVHHEPLTPKDAVLGSIICATHHLVIELERRE